MKKFISIFLCVAIVFCFTACAKPKNIPEFSDNKNSTTIDAEDAENVTDFSENSPKIIRNINSAIDKMNIKDKDTLSDKEIKSLEEQINGVCTKKDSKSNIYRFIVGNTVEFRLDMKNKQITFYVDDELYAQRTIK